MVVVPNGIRVEMFEPHPEKSVWARREFGCSAGDRVVAVVATIEHMKGHELFVDAAEVVARAVPSTRFVLIGRDSTPQGAVIKKRVEACGLISRFSFLGHRDDVADLLNGVDVLCLPSIGEGFPNVVAEAMCMQIPCVVTDVGDAARIVEDTGWIVPPRDSARLADAVIEALRSSPDALRERGRRARQRIVHDLTVDEMIRRTDLAYRQVLGEAPVSSAVS
jgi:glycosyltransferase involved in cell wall biosynthesis